MALNSEATIDAWLQCTTSSGAEGARAQKWLLLRDTYLLTIRMARACQGVELVPAWALLGFHTPTWRGGFESGALKCIPWSLAPPTSEGAGFCYSEFCRRPLVFGPIG